MTVAVLGGYGAVGHAALRQLHRWGVGPLRVGGRDVGLARAAAEPIGAEARGVDVDDAESLVRFCAGAAVVVNCAGPAHRIGARVGLAARRGGAHYVDAAGDDALRARLMQPRVGGWVAVVSAGWMPGLTGLLPRCVAAEMAVPAHELVGHVGGRDRFTLAGAVDYLATAHDVGEPLAAWRRGARVSRALAPLADVTPPFFSEPMTALPYLSTETERMAQVLNLTELRWYSVFAGGHTLAALRTANRHRPGAAGLLCRAAELDLFGYDPYQQLVVELAGADGRDGRTVVLRGSGAGALTGSVAALAARAVAGGLVNPGVHHACEVLDPGPSLAQLRTASVAELSVTSHDAAPVAGPYQEGVL